ncbi:MAG: hypothetical protein ACO206_03835 [Aquirufa sp.]|jgi:hypothetical protein
MKTTKIRLDVDQIGGNGSLTPSDEKMISHYIRDQKQNQTPAKKVATLDKTKNP